MIIINTEVGKNALSSINDQISLNKICIPEAKIYSHENYQIERKQQWVAAYQRGLDYVSKEWYKKISAKTRRKYLINDIKFMIVKLRNAVKSFLTK